MQNLTTQSMNIDEKANIHAILCKIAGVIAFLAPACVRRLFAVQNLTTQSMNIDKKANIHAILCKIAGVDCIPCTSLRAEALCSAKLNHVIDEYR